MIVDYHAHLGASTPLHVIWEIAKEQGLKLPTKDYFKFMEAMRVPNAIAHKAYLSKFDVVQKVQSSPMAIEKSVYSAITKAYCKYRLDVIELRFNPMLRNMGNHFDLDAVILHACIGMKKAMLAYPIKAGLIIETDRTFDAKKSEVLAHKAVEFKNEGIVGFDMSGLTKEGFDMKTFSTAFSIAKKGGLGITVHAGEVLDYSNVVEAIKLFEPNRVGHGINSHVSIPTMNMLEENNIALEVCPTSNVMTKVVDSYESMVEILRKLHDYGVQTIINTDGSEFLDISVKSEMESLEDYGLEDHIIRNKNVIDYSFIPQLQ